MRTRLEEGWMHTGYEQETAPAWSAESVHQG
jgi:hypothetical protein